MKKSLLLGTAISVTLGGITGAVAQSEDTIVVTATKREQTLQEVPVAVSVVDDSVIEQAQINDILDLQSIVPSLRVSQLEQSGNTSFIIRGFGNGSNNPGIEPSVGVFVDGVYRSRSAGAISDLPELQRVEVLRGPQSTLFGKNASAGVVSFITQAPQFETQGSVEATYGNYNQAIVKGYVTGPLSETVAYSLSGSLNQRDGYVDNNFLGTEINDRDRWALRGQLLFEPSSDLSFRFIADYDEINEKCCYAPHLFAGPFTQATQLLGGQFNDDPFTYETFLDRDPTNEITNGGISLTVEQNFENMDLTVITSYRDQSLLANGDTDFTSANIISGREVNNDVQTFTGEIRLASNGNSRFEWMVGGFLFDEQLQGDGNVFYGPQFSNYADILVEGAGLPGALGALEGLLGFGPDAFFENGTGSQEFFSQDNFSYSLFGQFDIGITDRLTLTLGGNYTEDNKTVQGQTVNNDLYSSLTLDQSPISDVIGQIVFGGVFQEATGLAATPTNIGGTPAMTLAAINAQAAALTPAAIGGLQQLQFLPPFVNFPNAVEDGETTDDNFSYTARLAFDLADNVNIYGGVATGFKASTWNLSRDSSYLASDAAALGAAGLLQPVRTNGTRFAGPEESLVYEIGLKSTFSWGSINVAVFDQTIEGFQSAIFTGTGFALGNAGEQSTVGLEVDAVVQPIEPLTLTFSGLFQDPQYDEFLQAACVEFDPRCQNGEVFRDLSGEQPAGIAETNISVSALYEKDLTADIMGFVRADYQYESDVQVIDNVPADVASREVNNVNASIGLNWENGLEAFIWGRNLTDDEYLTSAFPTTTQTGSFSGYPNAPQTYGVTVRKRF